eukprot:799974-Rhodomonas_salina.3
MPQVECAALKAHPLPNTVPHNPAADTRSHAVQAGVCLLRLRQVRVHNGPDPGQVQRRRQGRLLP